jgi:hypothetical protein
MVVVGSPVARTGGQSAGGTSGKAAPARAKPAQAPPKTELDKALGRIRALEAETAKLKSMAPTNPTLAGAQPVPAGPVKPSADIKKELDDLDLQTGDTVEDLRKAKRAEFAQAVQKDEDAEMAQLRCDLAALEKMSGVEQVHAAKQGRLDQLVEARRVAKPIGTRIKEVEEWVDRRAKALDKAKVMVADLAQQLVDLQAKHDEAAAEEGKRAEALREAETERAALYAKQAAEAGTGAGPASEPGALSPEVVAASKAVVDQLKAANIDPGALAVLEALLAAATRGARASPGEGPSSGGSRGSAAAPAAGAGAGANPEPQGAQRQQQQAMDIDVDAVVSKLQEADDDGEAFLAEVRAVIKKRKTAVA